MKLNNKGESVLEEKLIGKEETGLSLYKDFSVFAEIRGKTENEIVVECKMFEIRKVMEKLSVSVVRNDLSEKEKTALIEYALFCGMKSVVASPCYLDSVIAAIKRAKKDMNLISVVDFPFGEASEKSHIADIKDSVKKGVDGIISVFSASLFNSEDFKVTKKRLKKIGKIKGISKYFGVSAIDLNEGGIKRLVKCAAKYPVSGVALLFGDAKENEIAARINEIKAAGLKKPLTIFASVKDLSGVKFSNSLGADEIITPFAKEIGEELMDKFGVSGEFKR